MLICKKLLLMTFGTTLVSKDISNKRRGGYMELTETSRESEDLGKCNSTVPVAMFF